MAAATVLRRTRMSTLSHHDFLCGAGHARAVWAPPSDEARRIAWLRWLRGLAVCMLGGVAVAWVATWASSRGPLEATARMEQLAAKIDRARMLDRQTAQVIARLMRRPAYDCAQLPCGAALQARNSAARAQLAAAMARHVGAREASAALQPPP